MKKEERRCGGEKVISSRRDEVCGGRVLTCDRSAWNSVHAQPCASECASGCVCVCAWVRVCVCTHTLSVYFVSAQWRRIERELEV